MLGRLIYYTILFMSVHYLVASAAEGNYGSLIAWAVLGAMWMSVHEKPSNG